MPDTMTATRTVVSAATPAASPRWHVCRAPADWHRLVRALDEARRVGLEVYAPMLWVRVRQSRKVAGRRLVLERQVAAYPGWAFAPAVPHDVPGVRALVYADGAPVLISAAAVDRVRACELRWDAEHRDRDAAGVILPAGTWVTIRDGLFAGHQGCVVAKVRDGYAVQMDASLLGARTIVIRPAWVEAAEVAMAA
jgi:hypothetical protein